VELYEDKRAGLIIIKDGERTLRLTEEEFKAMRKSGTSPLLAKLWEAAKAEREASARKRR
jgi:hypothetical protein